MGRYGRNEDDDGGVCRPCVMLLVAIGMTIGGLVLISEASKDLRSEELAEFQGYVNHWKEDNRSQFVNSKFVLATKNGEVALAPDADVQRSRVADPGKDVPKFDPYEYTLPTDSNVQLISESTFASPQSSELYIHATYYSVNGAINSTIGPLKVPLTTEQKKHVSTPAPENRCRTQHGVYTGAQFCKVFARLRAMCIQVELDPKLGWQLHHSKIESESKLRGKHGETYGCDPVRHWNPASYAKVRAIHKPHEDAEGNKRVASFMRGWGPPDKAQQFQDFRFELRSAADPYMDAKKLTRNSTNFPISVHDAKILATIMFVIAALMAIQPIIEFRAFCADSAGRKRYAYQKTGEWEDAQTDLSESDFSSVVPTSVAPVRSRRSIHSADSSISTTVEVTEVAEVLETPEDLDEVGFHNLERSLHEPTATLHGRSPMELEITSSGSESEGSSGTLRPRSNRGSR